MSRLPRFVIVWVVAVAAVLAVPAPSLAQAEYKWTLTTFVPEGHQFFQDFIQTFVDRVSLITDGEVEIVAHGVGVLSGPFDNYQAVQQGRADLAFTVPYYLVNQHPANALLGGMVAGMAPHTMLNWLFGGDGEALWTEFRRDTTGLQPIIAGAGPTEIFAHSRKEISTLEDLEGVKFRTAGAWGQLLQELGASPTSIAPSELYTALERGIIDAAEFANPGTNVSAGLQDAAPFVIVPGIHAPASIYEVVIRADVWDGLPDNLKKKIKAAGRLAALESLIKSYHRDVGAVQTIKSSSAKVVELSPDFIEGVRKASIAWIEQHIDEHAEKGGDDWMERIWSSYSDYHSDWSEAAPFRWDDRLPD